MMCAVRRFIYYIIVIEMAEKNYLKKYAAEMEEDNHERLIVGISIYDGLYRSNAI